MYLRQDKKKNGRVYLTIIEGVWDSIKKQSKPKQIKALGYVDELIKEYPDPIAHFKQVAKEMSDAKKAENGSYMQIIHTDEEMTIGTDDRRNYGYMPIMMIFHELGLFTFIRNLQRSRDFKFHLGSVMELLVTNRIIDPASKLKACESRGRYFEDYDFEKHDVYDSLTFFAKNSDKIQKHINKKVCEKYGRDTEFIYFDVTNYYFEIDKPDELRKKHISKEHKPNPLVQMGLAMDKNGIPIAHELYSGNTNDALTLRPMLEKVKTEYDLGRVIVVADKGVNSSDNIYWLKNDNNKDGYVFSLSVRGANKKFKDYVLSDEGYVNTVSNINGVDVTFKIKSQIEKREIHVTKQNGGLMDKLVDEKHVIIWSKKYADRARAERAEAVAKAQSICKSPSKYNKSNVLGAARYLKNLQYDKKTGAVIEKSETGSALLIDEAKIKEEEKLDGYYAIVTSEVNQSDEWVLNAYKGLWEIEESFKITKSELDARPVFVSTPDHIKAHFLVCFIALIIIRLLEKKLNSAYPFTQIINTMRRMECSKEFENMYLFDYYTEIVEALGNACGVSFSQRRLTLGGIKSLSAACKK